MRILQCTLKVIRNMSKWLFFLDYMYGWQHTTSKKDYEFVLLFYREVDKGDENRIEHQPESEYFVSCLQ